MLSDDFLFLSEIILRRVDEETYTMDLIYCIAKETYFPYIYQLSRKRTHFSRNQVCKFDLEHSTCLQIVVNFVTIYMLICLQNDMFYYIQT